MSKPAEQDISRDLEILTADPQGRPVGSASNRAAARHVARRFAESGWEVERQELKCAEWTCRSLSLALDGSRVDDAVPNPYSPACEVSGGELIVLESAEDLHRLSIGGKVVLLRGELAAEQYTPKRYPFYAVEKHGRVIGLLETGGALAVLGATPKDSVMEPLFEDGDASFPGVTVSRRLANSLETGARVDLHMDCVSRPSTAWNVLARLEGEGPSPVVLTAHLDTKPGTPGALDNASGVATLLLLARMIADVDPRPACEIAALNGEDHYAAPGQVEYMRRLDERPKPRLAMNFDGIGMAGAMDTVARFGLDEATSRLLDEALERSEAVREIEPWPMGDHMLFVARGVPALAYTSERAFELLETLIHTENDKPELVSAARILETAGFAAGLLARLGRQDR